MKIAHFLYPTRMNLVAKLKEKKITPGKFQKEQIENVMYSGSTHTTDSNEKYGGRYCSPNQVRALSTCSSSLGSSVTRAA